MTGLYKFLGFHGSFVRVPILWPLRCVV